jgi:predicted branched-subunit amino acid permease
VEVVPSVFLAVVLDAVEETFLAAATLAAATAVAAVVVGAAVAVVAVAVAIAAVADASSRIESPASTSSSKDRCIRALNPR